MKLKSKQNILFIPFLIYLYPANIYAKSSHEINIIEQVLYNKCIIDPLYRYKLSNGQIPIYFPKVNNHTQQASEHLAYLLKLAIYLHYQQDIEYNTIQQALLKQQLLTNVNKSFERISLLAIKRAMYEMGYTQIAGFNIDDFRKIFDNKEYYQVIIAIDQNDSYVLVMPINDEFSGIYYSTGCYYKVPLSALNSIIKPNVLTIYNKKSTE